MRMLHQLHAYAHFFYPRNPAGIFFIQRLTMSKRKHFFTALFAALCFFSSHAKAEDISNASTRVWACVAALFGLFNLSEWGVIIGIALGIGSFVLTYIFKDRNHRILKHIAEKQHITAKELAENMRRFDD